MRYLAKVDLHIPIEAEDSDHAQQILSDMDLKIIHPETDKEMEYNFADWTVTED